MGCAVLSIIFWIINCQCWSKKSCCLKEYHNPQNIRTFWWLCFIFFCGVLACCISGILVSLNFRKKVGSAKCIYERIYYDSKYGELKDGTKWEGLDNRTELINKLNNFIDNTHTYKGTNYKKNFDKNWKEGNNKLCLKEDVNYPQEFINEIEYVFNNCTKHGGQIYSNENSKLIFDNFDKCSSSSLYYEYINETTTICNYFSEQMLKMKEYVDDKESDHRVSYKHQINLMNNTLEKISDDLINYQEKFLDDVDYFLKLAKIFGFIVVLVYYSIVIAIVLLSCVLLWAYSYFKEQRIIYTLMHVAWNILKFFSFSFFLFGAAFGALYLCARDLIGYNQYIFTTNLEEAETKFLPTEEAKTFLGFCMKNSSDHNYINNLNMNVIKDYISKFYNNKKHEEYIANGDYDFSILNKSYSCYSSINRRLQGFEGPTSDMSDIGTDGTDETDEHVVLFDINFTEAGNKLHEKIKEFYDELSNPKKERRRRNLGETIEFFSDFNKLAAELETLNCGFLRNELQILFDCLYELSIESRISCALCCCIGFFIEVAINFYLLVIYHYNNQQFKEGKESKDQFKINQQRKFDMESQNEFMDKSKPPNLKNKNKKLDLEFSLNE